MFFVIGLTIATIPFLSCMEHYHTNSDVNKTLIKKNDESLEQSVLQLINEHRKSIHLNSLQMMNEITVQAFYHSKEMAEQKVAFGHAGFESRVDNIRKSIGFIFGWAENVAAGQTSAKEVVSEWLHSPGHKKNIEGNYNFTGIGICKDANGMLYFTQIFIQKK